MDIQEHAEAERAVKRAMEKQKPLLCDVEERFEVRARELVADLKGMLGTGNDVYHAGDFPADWRDVATAADALGNWAATAKNHIAKCKRCKLASKNGYGAV